MEEQNQIGQVVEEQEQKPKSKKIKRRIALVFIVILLVCAGIYIVNEMKYESTDDAYVENISVSVAPRVSGQIENVYITDNQFVNKGELVATIDSADYKVKVDQADANYERIKLDQSNAKANLTAAESNIELAKKDLDRYTNLYAQGAVSKQTLDAAEVKYNNAKAGLTQAQQALLSNDNKTVADANLANAKAAKDKADLELSYTKIYAPQSGTVAS
ncbi:HlyD family secretion protein, partial [bacterium]|nr:HlyD family secretion protein [bacterium]